MGKKHRFRKPQQRKRLKATTGKREFINVVYLEKEQIRDAETSEYRDNIYATCTCGWRSSSEASTIVQVANEAKEHCDASEGKCRLRQHAAPSPDIQSEDADTSSDDTQGDVSAALADGNGVPDPLSEEALS